MLIELLAALSLYPWNFNAGGYYTFATFRDNLVYHGQTAVVSLDRKNKDLLLARYEHFLITGDGPDYEQQNLIVRGVWWADSRVRPGVFAWKPFNKFKADEYYVGGTLEGDFGAIGYKLAMVHKHVNATVSQGRSRGFRGFNQDQESQQYDVAAHRWFGPHRIQTGVTVVDVEGTQYTLYRFATLSKVSRRVTLFLEYATGQSMYYVEPFDAAVHDSQDILNAQYVAGAGVRFTPNLHGYLSYIRLDMEPIRAGSMWPETKQYYTAGLRIRL